MDPDPGGPKTCGSDAEPDTASQNDAYPCRSRSATLVTRHHEMYIADLDQNRFKDVPHSISNFQLKKAFLGRPTCGSIRLNQLGIVSVWSVGGSLVLLPRQQLAQDQALSIGCKSRDIFTGRKRICTDEKLRKLLQKLDSLYFFTPGLFSQIVFLWATYTNFTLLKIMKVFVTQGAPQMLHEKNVSIDCHIWDRSYT
jgi:hypothetical protein